MSNIKATGTLVPREEKARTDEETAKAFRWIVKHRYHDDVYDPKNEKSKAAYEEFIAIRAILLETKPFWGVTALELTYVDTDHIPGMSARCKYAAVDPYHMYINPVGFMSLTDDERETAVAHEVTHVILGQIAMRVVNRDGHYWLDRCGDRLPTRWNIAVDHVDNLTIYEAGFKKFTSFKAYADPQFTGMTSEEVYDIIDQDPEKHNANGQEFDLHISFEISEDGTSTDSDEDGEGNSQGKSRITAEDYKDRLEAWDQAMTRGYMIHKRKEADGSIQGGSLPAGILRQVQELNKPRTEWFDHLRVFMEECLVEDYSFQEPDNRFFSEGITLPGIMSYDEEYLDGASFFDLSGSVDDSRMNRSVSEFWGIIEKFDRFRILAGSFDAVVQEDTVRYFEQDNREEFTEWMKNLAGCGGTVFRCVQDYLKERGIRPRFLIFWTDGEPCGNDWGDPDFCPTLFFIMGHGGREIIAPYGVSINFPIVNER